MVRASTRAQGRAWRASAASERPPERLQDGIAALACHGSRRCCGRRRGRRCGRRRRRRRGRRQGRRRGRPYRRIVRGQCGVCQLRGWHDEPSLPRHRLRWRRRRRSVARRVCSTAGRAPSGPCTAEAATYAGSMATHPGTCSPSAAPRPPAAVAWCAARRPSRPAEHVLRGFCAAGAGDPPERSASPCEVRRAQAGKQASAPRCAAQPCCAQVFPCACRTGAACRGV